MRGWKQNEILMRELFLIFNKQGKVVVTRVSEVLLCLIGSDLAEFGMLKAKVDA